jgi:hypothetical protein
MGEEVTRLVWDGIRRVHLCAKQNIVVLLMIKVIFKTSASHTVWTYN